MKPIVEKVLSSGLVDKSTAILLEQWGYLPNGASDKVNEDALVNKTRETMEKLAEDLANEIEKEHHIRESALDLERLRWPVTASILRYPSGTREQIAYKIPGLIDRMGRYYFRIQDVEESWFVPGYFIATYSEPNSKYSEEVIAEKQVLYIDEIPVCVQVSVLSDVSLRVIGD